MSALIATIVWSRLILTAKKEGKHMNALDEFLRDNASRLQHPSNSSVDEGVVLQGILLEGSGETVVFAHLGVKFQIAKTDVMAVRSSAQPMPNPFSAGVPCELVVSKQAQLVRSEAIPVMELMQQVPYAVARPSMAAPGGQRFIDADIREASWLRERGIVPSNQTVATTYTGTQSSQITHTYSSSYSGGVPDDSSVDDSNSDSMGRDDANPDDVSSAAFTPASTYTDTTSSQFTGTYSGTQSGPMTDDSGVDDSNSDSMGRDDANADD